MNPIEQQVHDFAYHAGVYAGKAFVQLELNSQLLNRLEERAARDDLTSLYIREYLISEFNRLSNTSHSRRQLDLDLATCMLALDVDYFCDINNSYGHDVGNQVLIRLAEVLKVHAKREDDIAAIVGGEEFCILLPRTELATGISIAEKLRLSVANDAVIRDILDEAT